MGVSNTRRMEFDRKACPDHEAMAAWIDGGLAVDDRSALEAHLVLCERCRSVVAFVLEAQDAVVAALPRGGGRGGVALGWVAGVAVVTMAAVLMFGVVPRRERRRRTAASKLAGLVDADE